MVYLTNHKGNQFLTISFALKRLKLYFTYIKIMKTKFVVRMHVVQDIRNNKCILAVKIAVTFVIQLRNVKFSLQSKMIRRFK